MAATSYTIHKTTDIDGISLVVPDGEKITVTDNDASTITVTIPSGTTMKLDSSEEHFNYNFCAYIAVDFNNNNNGSSIQKPAKDIISTINGDSSAPSTDNYKVFCNQVILFHKGQSYDFGYQKGWSHSLASDKTITITAPSGTTDYTVYVCGCSMGTKTYRKFYFDPYVNGISPSDGDCDWSYTDYSWTSLPNPIYKGDGDSRVWDVGGNSCGHSHTATEFAETNALWTNITKGSVNITDHQNNTITVWGTNGKRGSNNNINTTTLIVKLGSKTLTASGSNSDAGGPLANSSQDTFSYNYTITASGTITAKLTNTGNKGDTATASDTEDVKFYTPPKWKNAAKLTFDSGDEGQYNDRPRLKKPLKWTWSGAVAGNTEDHNVIRGYQIYICNGGGGTDKAVGLYPYRGKFTLNSGNTSPGAKVFETSTDDSAGAYAYVINRGTTNNTLVTDGSGNISFTPIDLGFASKNICYCRVRPFSYWGNRVATKELGSDGNKATYTQYAKNYGPWLIGICTADGSDTTATYIKGTQCVLSNGAVVWVRVDTNGDGTPDTWKEGTVYVYHNNKWKEAEGVYVRNGSKWKEST